jgi:hypothetical protein
LCLYLWRSFKFIFMKCLSIKSSTIFFSCPITTTFAAQPNLLVFCQYKIWSMNCEVSQYITSTVL